MSFADAGRAQASRAGPSSSVRNPSALADLLRDAERSIREVLQQSNNIKGIVESKLGTKKDDHELRSKLKLQVESTNKLAKETGAKLKAIAEITSAHKDELPPAQLASANKLRTDFQNALTTLQAATRLSVEKQKKLVAQEKTTVKQAKQSVETIADPGSSDNDANESDSLIEANRRRQRQLQMQSEISFNEAVIAEREEGIHGVEESLIEINQIMLQMSGMVIKQGQDLDLMEDAIEATRNHTIAANKELKATTKHQKSGRKLMCFILFTVLLLIVGIVIYYSLRK